MEEIDCGIERPTMPLTRIPVTREKPRFLAAWPAFGPGRASDLREQIRSYRAPAAPNEQVIDVPTFAQCVSFVLLAYGKEVREFREATRIMRENYFRGYTATHTTDDEGLDGKLVYIIDFQEGFPDFDENGRVYVDNTELIKRLEANDASVRTISKSDMPKTGPRTPRELAKDKYLGALVGEEGAEEAAQLADKYTRHEGYFWVPNMNKPATTLAALFSNYCGDRLVVLGGDCYHGRGGCAFGVFL